MLASETDPSETPLFPVPASWGGDGSPVIDLAGESNVDPPTPKAKAAPKAIPRTRQEVIALAGETLVAPPAASPKAKAKGKAKGKASPKA